MSEIQVIEKNGRPEWAVLPYADYLRLIAQAEMLEDMADFDRLHAAVADGTEEVLPAALAYALADGANPVKAWREQRQISRRDLAQRAQISVPYLSQIEAGKRQPSLRVLTALAAHLRLELDDLLG